MTEGLSKMASHYIALIHKEPGSGYGVSFPDLLGVTTVADKLDDALRKASVALAFAREDWPGGAPRARTLDVLRNDPVFIDWSADAVVAAVSPTSSMNEAA